MVGEIINRLIDQAPGVAALVLVVLAFLRAQDARDKQFQADRKDAEIAQAERDKTQAKREKDLTDFLGGLLSNLTAVIRESSATQTAAITQVMREVTAMRREFAEHDTFVKATLKTKTEPKSAREYRDD